jgi:hypothetical protein
MPQFIAKILAWVLQLSFQQILGLTKVLDGDRS